MTASMPQVEAIYLPSFNTICGAKDVEGGPECWDKVIEGDDFIGQFR